MVPEIFLLPPRHPTHLRPFFSHLPLPLSLSALSLPLSLFLSHSLPPFVFYHEFHPRDISLPRHVQLAAQRSVVSLCSTRPSPPRPSFSSLFFCVCRPATTIAHSRPRVSPLVHPRPTTRSATSSLPVPLAGFRRVEREFTFQQARLQPRGIRIYLVSQSSSFFSLLFERVLFTRRGSSPFDRAEHATLSVLFLTG